MAQHSDVAPKMIPLKRCQSPSARSAQWRGDPRRPRFRPPRRPPADPGRALTDPCSIPSAHSSRTPGETGNIQLGLAQLEETLDHRGLPQTGASRSSRLSHFGKRCFDGLLLHLLNFPVAGHRGDRHILTRKCNSRRSEAQQPNPRSRHSGVRPPRTLEL
jgi:hypothetical protein